MDVVRSRCCITVSAAQVTGHVLRRLHKGIRNCQLNFAGNGKGGPKTRAAVKREGEYLHFLIETGVSHSFGITVAFPAASDDKSGRPRNQFETLEQKVFNKKYSGSFRNTRAVSPSETNP
jgi:hypothetical protein